MRSFARAAALVTIVAALLAGCGRTDPAARPDDDGSPAASDWSTASYSYSLDSRCGERAFMGVYRVVVEHGAVVSAVPADATRERPESAEQLATFPTIANLMARAQARGAAAPSEYHVDPETGVPTWISFEGDPNAIDDEECYRITDYESAAHEG